MRPKDISFAGEIAGHKLSDDDAAADSRVPSGNRRAF
jgi:hypothetical protein